MRYPALLGFLIGMIIFLAAVGVFFLTLVICAELDGYRFKLVEIPQGEEASK